MSSSEMLSVSEMRTCMTSFNMSSVTRSVTASFFRCTSEMKQNEKELFAFYLACSSFKLTKCRVMAICLKQCLQKIGLKKERERRADGRWTDRMTDGQQIDR